MAYVDKLRYPLRVVNDRSFIRLIDDDGYSVGYANHVIIPSPQTGKCFRQFVFNVKNRSYIATSVVRLGIEIIYKVKPHPYVKTGENVHHFKIGLPSTTKAKSKRKIGLKASHIGNGEGVSQYSLDSAGIKVDRIKGDYCEEKYHLQCPPKKVLSRAKEEQMQSINTAQMKTLSTVQTGTKKEHIFEVFVQNRPNSADIIRATSVVEPDKRYVLVNRCELVEV